ncbi:MAG: hypothetical protein LBH16_10825 [Treponema sp.]|jgi:hypothetical protein|nr:hypothetical protein [Treponema sp.]
MKYFLLGAILLICAAGASVSAWEPADLAKYPDCTKAGDFLINFGVGLSVPNDGLGSGYVYVPPVRVSVDYNIPIGAGKLPFFAGGVAGYSGYGYRNEWFYSSISFGGRFGYHFNWGIEKLDTYAVLSAGWIIYAGDYRPAETGMPLAGFNAGGRYYLAKTFGFWAELGFTTFSWIDVGVTLKF